MKKSIAACLCVKDCEKYLPSIFKNLDLLSKYYTLSCIFVYDNCSDNSEQLIKQYKTESKHKVYIEKIVNNLSGRTIRIAKARNTCLDIVYNKIKTPDFHIMIDADDVNEKPWNINTINKYLQNDNNEWDALSFNRTPYFDIWALLYDDIKHHCWGFGEHSKQIIDYMRKDISNKLKHSTTDNIKCLSAFNGFAIYKTKRFRGIKYNGLYKNIKHFINDQERKTTLNLFKDQINKDVDIIEPPILNPWKLSPKEDFICEHIYYHLSAIKNNKCVKKISKFCL